MRAALLLVGALLVAPSALAQTTDPTVNDSDFNTTPPAADASYMNDTNSSSSNATTDPTVSDSDFNTTAPPADTSYLDDAARQYGVDANGTTTTSASAKTPAPGLALLVGVALAAALVVRGRRRSR